MGLSKLCYCQHFYTGNHLVMCVGMAYPAGGKRLSLLVLQVLLNVDKRVEEDGCHF